MVPAFARAPAVDPPAGSTALDALNSVPPARARAVLLECCGSERWAEDVAAGRPYASARALLDAAGAAWARLGGEDRLAAFAAHARVGEPDPADRQGRAEQAGAGSATPSQRAALRAGNLAYEARFGHVFLVCATGLGAAEMLAALARRLANPAPVELEIAAAEQARITDLRLRRLLGEPPPGDLDPDGAG